MSRVKINRNRSTRRIEIRLYGRPPHKGSLTVYRAPNGSMYEGSHVDDILEDFANKLEAQFPNLEFRLVEKKDWKFSFVFVREKNFAEIPNKAAQIMKEIEIGKSIDSARRIVETPAVPVPQESSRVEDHHD